MKKLILIISILFLSHTSYAAIAVGNTSNNGTQNSTLTSTVSHVVATGSNRLLVTLIAIDHDKDDPVPGASLGVATVLYGAQSMTKLRADPGTSGGDEPDSEIWYLVAPTEGTANVVVTYVQTQYIVGVSNIDFTGVDQSTPFEANAGKTQTSGTSVTQAITTATNGAYIVTVMASKLNDGVVADASQTVIYQNNSTNAGPGANLASASSYELKTTAGSDTQSFTSVGDDDTSISVGAIKPASSTTVSRFQPQMVMI